MSKEPIAIATGRRKTSTARIRVSPGSGNIQINGRALERYLPTEDLQNIALESLRASEKTKDYDFLIITNGGGLVSQAGAIRHAIARALCDLDANLRPNLKKLGLLTRDSRMKERKKSGQPGARKRFQFSKR